MRHDGEGCHSKGDVGRGNEWRQGAAERAAYISDARRGKACTSCRSSGSSSARAGARVWDPHFCARGPRPLRHVRFPAHPTPPGLVARHSESAATVASKHARRRRSTLPRDWLRVRARALSASCAARCRTLEGSVQRRAPPAPARRHRRPAQRVLGAARGTARRGGRRGEPRRGVMGGGASSGKAGDLRTARLVTWRGATRRAGQPAPKERERGGRAPQACVTTA
eukprot:360081-Chlamydomonas_euryale.AAC.3